MSSVVLRCPTCGTTQNHTGECEACSDADVRYFCTDHSPGLWLTESRCSACGAKFGDAAPATPKSTPRAATRPAVSRPDTRPAPRAAEPGRAAPTRPPFRVVEADEADAAPSLAEVLVGMLEEGRRSADTVYERPRSEPPMAAAPRTSPVAGCLGRLMLMVLLLVVLALAGLSTFFSVVFY